MATTQVFIDDAVRGRLPDLCVKDGVPTGGSRLRITKEIGATSRIGVLWLLVVAGPVGWVLLLFLSGRDQGERLTVTLPFSDAAYERHRAAKRARQGSILVLVTGGAAIMALGAVTNEPVLLAAGLVTAAGSLLASIIGEVRLDRTTVDLDLDASRRWLTIGRVHPDFAQACAAHEATQEVRRA